MTGLWSLRVPYPTRKYWWRLLHNTGETQEQVLHLFRSVDTSMRAAASNVSRPGRAAAWKGEALISAFCLTEHAPAAPLKHHQTVVKFRGFRAAFKDGPDPTFVSPDAK